MAQITELKANAIMGPLLGRDFSGKTEYVEPGTTTIQPRKEDERLVRVPLVSIFFALMGVSWL